MLILPFLACSHDDDHGPEDMGIMFVENPERTIKVNIFYVETEETSDKSSYNLDEGEFIEYLNGYYFHRYGIGLELGESRVLINSELYDLRDNQGSEPSTFFMQTQDSYEEDKINIYIIKRSNIIGIAGMGRIQRVLLTYENLFTSTSPHEIGHSLGLFHNDEVKNIMSTTLDKQSRQVFNGNQEDKMKKRIDELKYGKSISAR